MPRAKANPEAPVPAAPADQAVLDATKAAQERGEDPFGDDEPLVPESNDQRAAKARVAAAVEDGEEPDAADLEQAADPNEPDNDEEPPVGDAPPEPKPREESPVDLDDEDDAEPAPYRGKTLDAIEEEAKALRAEKRAEFKKLMSGDLDDDAYSEKEGDIQSKLDALLVQRAKAESRNEAILDHENGILMAIKRDAKKAGFDYDAVEDKRAVTQFDAALRAIAATAEPGRTFKSIAKEAHATVMALRGIAKARQAEAPKPPAPRQQGRGAPLTLRNLPAAGTPNTGGDPLVDSMRHLKGPAYEAAYSKLTPGQKAKLLDE